MAKQIVAVQSTLLDMSERFPNAFDGYKLSVKESHQKTKADTSGTAKALVAYMSKLTGSDFSFEQIVKLRDRDSQLQFGVPEESLDGHAFHTYTVTSGDGTVQFELKHNVCGRRVYAEGTADAVEYLIAVREGKVGDSSRRLYNMIDVLQSGSMK
jgi:4-hydroxy-tetrahydrodipicolinate reductase